MSSKKLKKLFKVASQFNISYQTIVDILSENGFEVMNRPNSNITPEMYEVLVNIYGEATNEQDDIHDKEKDHSLSAGINPSKLIGPWRAGWSLDQHTVSSSMNPDGTFSTIRTEIGEKLYQLKYCNNVSELDSLAEIAADFIKNLLVYNYLAGIIPIPPSYLDRHYQPVFMLIEKIGELTNLSAPTDYLIKMKKTQPLKEISDEESRKEQLSEAFTVSDNRYRGKYVLIFDDLYRSGETLSAASTVLIEQGGVSRVFALTLTRTRVNR